MVRPKYRILITASRDWLAPWEMWRWLDGQLAKAVEDGLWAPGDIVVIHGDAPGGDQIGKLWAQVRGHEHEPHPADWNGPCRSDCDHPRKFNAKRGGWYCPAAGIYRNQDMVALGADICGAFIRDGSHGASHCSRIARFAGIPTEVYTHA